MFFWDTQNNIYVYFFLLWKSLLTNRKTEPDIWSGGIQISGLVGPESSKLNNAEPKPAIYYGTRYSFTHLHSRCQNIQTENIIKAGHLSIAGWKIIFHPLFAHGLRTHFYRHNEWYFEKLFNLAKSFIDLLDLL